MRQLVEMACNRPERCRRMWPQPRLARLPPGPGMLPSPVTYRRFCLALWMFASAEASFVDVPADPTARPTKLWKHTDDLMRAVRNAFPNAPALCNHCREPYHGLPQPLDLTDPAALFWIS
jgi:hypothetical protein